MAKDIQLHYVNIRDEVSRDYNRLQEPGKALKSKGILLVPVARPQAQDSEDFQGRLVASNIEKHSLKDKRVAQTLARMQHSCWASCKCCSHSKGTDAATAFKS